MDPIWWLLWASLPVLLLIYTAMTIFMIYGHVRVCRTRLNELDGKVAELNKKLEQIRLDLRSRE